MMAASASAMAGAVGVATLSTARGWIAFAWSARGLVAVTLPRPTEAETLAGVPPAAAHPPAPPPGLDVPILADRLRRYFAGEPVEFDEPLDPAIGTAFQKRVWNLCRAIPRGQTRTYAELADGAGSSGAARAVGQAMARNPWPPLVPCHRVVGSDRSLTGYGGGLDLKRYLLLVEGAEL